MILDRTGREFTASRPYPITAPAPGHAETDPDAWLTAIASALEELNGTVGAYGGAGGAGVADVTAIVLSGQMHGTVVARKDPTDGHPVALAPAILWADTRGATELARYTELSPDRRRVLGNRPASGMTGPNLLWLLKHRPELLDQADGILFPKDYVRGVLTGAWTTDRSDASGSLLYDFEHRDWDVVLASELGIPGRLLPPVGFSIDDGGTICEAAARRLGLPAGIPVAIGAGDTPAAMYGTRLEDPQTAQISVGTAAQVTRPIGVNEIPDPSSINLFEGAEPALRYQVAAMLNGGLALEWVRNRLGFEWDEIYREMEDDLLRDPGDLVFLPYLTGERTPHLNADARGAWLGLATHHTNVDLARAALLGVACTVRWGLETLEARRDRSVSVRLVGGSFRYAPWRRLVSTVIGRDVRYTESTDSSARGAAYLGARRIGDPLPAPPSFIPETSTPSEWVDRYYRYFQERYQALN